MLLQGTQSSQQKRQAGTAPSQHRTPEPSQDRTPEPSQRRVTVPAASPAPRRAYAPISWARPSLGRSVADGVGGISRSVVLITLLGAALIGTAMVIALVLTGVVSAFGFDFSSSY